jgi:CheY-like chemotaxis protein
LTGPNTLKTKILLIEDDEVNLELLKFYLHPHYDLATATNVEEAWEQVRKQLPDMIICDIDMGAGAKEDGVDFLKKLRADSANRHIPVVAYTAYNNPNDTNEVQFTSYIPKPVTRTEFLKAVSDILAAR